jgi:hypothetical protein
MSDKSAYQYLRHVNASVTRRKILHGPPALLPIRRKLCCGFYRPYKSISSAGFEPATLGSSSKNINHYTTEATIYNRYSYLFLAWTDVILRRLPRLQKAITHTHLTRALYYKAQQYAMRAQSALKSVSIPQSLSWQRRIWTPLILSCLPQCMGI